MRTRSLILLASSAVLLGGCAWMMSMIGLDPETTRETAKDAHRVAHATADTMELLYEMMRLGAAWLGGMITVPGTKMMGRGLKKAAGLIKRKQVVVNNNVGKDG